MFNAASTMGQLQQRMDLTSNNLANVNNHGYKTRHSNFSSLLNQQVNNLLDHDADSPRLTPDGIRVGSGARLGHENMNMDSGSLQETGRGLDVALQDRNRFFTVSVEGNDGAVEDHYTKSGNFYLSNMDDGTFMLTSSEGNPVQGEDGPIIIDENFNDVRFNDNGDVIVTRDGEEAVEGTLQLVDIPNSRVLQPVDAGTFIINEDELGVPADALTEVVAPADANLVSGSLETSNVDYGTEVQNLMESQRAYSFNARSLSMGDQMMGLIGSMRN